jgi:hypothetical protein
MSFKEKMIEYLQRDRRRSIYVSELDETIYFSPVTVLEMEKILTVSQGQTSATHVWALIEKAEDADGKKIFSVEDKPILEKLDWKIVTGITGEMLNVLPIPEVKKTLETAPSS